MLIDVWNPDPSLPAPPSQYRCWVDDIEVTDECIRADDEEGFADVYLLSDKGLKYTWDDGCPAWTRLHGEVRLELRDAK